MYLKLLLLKKNIFPSSEVLCNTFLSQIRKIEFKLDFA